MSGWSAPAPVAVREIENDWIVMPDGVRLAVSLWLPDTPDPAPVVLESIPYRKRDSTRGYSRYWGRLLAQHSIGFARLDCRGSGDSEGVLTDEYLPLEQHDAAAAIAWLAAQSWCNGAVGMRGVSWGGFAALQTAALRPPALKAIMPFCATDRRYTDDAHYVGGAFALTGLKWATSFKLVMAAPPDPEVFGPGWEDAWRARLDSAPPIAAEWLSHQREDAYWRQGSVGFDPAAITCPTYLVGGWADPYNAALVRLLESLRVPTKAVIGPWGHGYPQPASPGPGLAWIEEEVRWWRHWLADEPTGVMEGPKVWAYVPDVSPAELPNIRGRWVEAQWPSPDPPQILHLAPGRLAEEPGDGGIVSLTSDPAVGLRTPEWCPFSPSQYPQEQSPDDARSLVFDSQFFVSPVELLGTPVLRLRLAADRPVAKLVARLCERRADGSSWLVSYGVLNLTHRDSHAEPAPLTRGEAYDIELPLYPAARRFEAGSRLRLALSESLWPLLWPSPGPVTLRLDLAHASLTLPVRRWLGGAFPLAVDQRTGGGRGGSPQIAHAVSADGVVSFREVSPASAGTIEATGATIERFGPDLDLSVRTDDPTTCRWHVRQGVRYRRGGGDWDCALEAEVEITAGAATFHVRERLTAKRGEAVVFEREEAADIPRDLM